MITKVAIEDFLHQKLIAVAGASQNKRKFGNIAYRDLKAKGYGVIPVNPHAVNIDGDPCCRSVKDLPEEAEGVLIVAPPEQTEKIVREAHAKGIRRIWMQPGAESEEAVRFCKENGISAIHGYCILMLAEPVTLPHNIHRWARGLLGKLPR